MNVPEINWQIADMAVRHTEGEEFLWWWLPRQVDFFQGRLWTVEHDWTLLVDHVAQLTTGGRKPVLSEAVLSGVRLQSVAAWFDEISDARGEWVVVLRPRLTFPQRLVLAGRLETATGTAYGYPDLRLLWFAGAAEAWWRRAAWAWVYHRHPTTRHPPSRHCASHVVEAGVGIFDWPRNWDQHPRDWIRRAGLVGCAPLVDLLLTTGQAHVVWASRNAPLGARALEVTGRLRR